MNEEEIKTWSKTEKESETQREVKIKKQTNAEIIQREITIK